MTDPLVQPAHDALDAGYYQAAIDHCRQALEQANQANVRVALHQALAVAQRELGLLLTADHELEKAIELARQDESAHPEALVRLQLERAATKVAAFNFEEAEALLRSSGRSPRRSPRARALSAFAKALATQAIDGEARAAKPLKRAVQMYRSAYGPGHPRTLNATVYLAVSARSISMLEDALDLARSSLRADHPTTYSILLHLGYLHLAAEDNSAAELALREALAIGERSLAADNVDLAVNRYWLARALMWNGNWKEAEALLRRALEVSEAAADECPPARVYALWVRRYLVSAALHNQSADAAQLVGDCWNASERVRARRDGQDRKARETWLDATLRIAATDLRMTSGLGDQVGDLPEVKSFDRLTHTARLAVAMARRSAIATRSDRVGTELLLLGMLSPEAGAGIASRILSPAVKAEEVRRSIARVNKTRVKGRRTEAQVWPSINRMFSFLSANLMRPAPDPVPPATELFRQVMLQAFSAADAESPTSPADTHHVLEALAANDEGIAHEVLAKAGLSVKRIRASASRLASGGPTEP